MIFYYFILGFGFLLLLYTAKGFFSAKKKINPSSNDDSLLVTFWRNLKKQWEVWKFYFTGGNPENTLRNVLISILILGLSIVLNKELLQMPMDIFLAVFVLFYILGIWKWGQRRNKKIFYLAFPEVIQILNSATTAGAGLLQALARCGKDVQGQLGTEFKQIHKRLAIGEDVSSVFEDSYLRYPYKEYYYFITIVRINMEKGGQMREVISRLGRIIADSQKMEQKKRAMTSEARISALIVGSFPIAFFIFMKFTMPENFDFVLHDDRGRLVLYYVLGSEVLGMSIIWWLMKKAS